RVAAPVPRDAASMDEGAVGEIVERRRQARLVAAAGSAERGLRNAWVLADQRQHGEAPRRKIEIAHPARERLERRLLCEPQVKADEIGERAEAHRLRRRRCELGLPHLCQARCHGLVPAFSSLSPWPTRSPAPTWVAGEAMRTLLSARLPVPARVWR